MASPPASQESEDDFKEVKGHVAPCPSLREAVLLPCADAAALQVFTPLSCGFVRDV